MPIATIFKYCEKFNTPKSMASGYAFRISDFYIGKHMIGGVLGKNGSGKYGSGKIAQ
jgi:ABC-type multidrug transport system ATPase subunit